MSKFIKHQGQVYQRVDANTTDFIDGLTLACEKARKLINNDFRFELKASVVLDEKYNQAEVLFRIFG